jgi:Zn-dependent protease with chaperone function
MEQSAYRALIERSKRTASAHPTWYGIRINAWIALGRLVPVAAGVVALGLIGGFGLLVCFAPAVLLFAKFLLVLLFPAFTALKSMALPLEPLPDMELTRSEYPLLWDTVERVARRTNARVPDRIFARSDLNASIGFRRGRFGLRNVSYLTVGAQLMHCLTPQQMEAVLAHELAHLMRGHGRIGARAWRTELILHRMAEQLHGNESRGARMLRRFCAWYMPRYSALTYALRYQHEIDADRVAAEATSPQIHASALAALALRSMRRDGLYQKCAFTGTLESDGVLVAMCAASGDELNRHRSTLALAGVLLEEQSLADEHPTLARRMSIAGYASPVSADVGLVDGQRLTDIIDLVTPALTPSAADALLGAGRVSLLQRLDAAHREARPDAEHETARDVQRLRTRAAELDRIVPTGSVRAGALRMFGRLWTAQGRDDEGLVEYLRTFVAAFPDHAFAHFELGFRLLGMAADLQEANVHLERAEQLAPELEAAVNNVRRTDAVVRGDAATYRDTTTRRDELDEQVQRAMTALHGELTSADEFTPAQLDPLQHAALTARLIAIPNISGAWVSQRVHTDPLIAGDYIVIVNCSHASDVETQTFIEAMDDLVIEMQGDCRPFEEWSLFVGGIDSDPALTERLKHPDCFWSVTAPSDDATTEPTDNVRPIRSYADIQAQLFRDAA